MLWGAVTGPVKGPAQLLHQQRPNTVKHLYKNTDERFVDGRKLMGTFLKAAKLISCTRPPNSINYSIKMMFSCPHHVPYLTSPWCLLLDIWSNIWLNFGKRT